MMKRFLCLLLCVSICSSLARPVKAATNEYLNITLADIIVAWYNASGVAIGDTQLANAIYDTYGSITIDDLIEHDCIRAVDLVYPLNSPEMRDYTRELIGYGNLAVPMIDVSVSHLQNYLSGFPISDVARQSLEAMFGWEGNLYNEVMFAILGTAIGTVANIGKIGYQLAVDTISDVSDEVKNSYLGKTLLDVYRHFTDTTYFQDLLNPEPPEVGPPAGTVNITLSYPLSGYDGRGGVYSSLDRQTFSGAVFLLYRDIVPVIVHKDYPTNKMNLVCCVNLTDSTKTIRWGFSNYLTAGSNVTTIGSLTKQLPPHSVTTIYDGTSGNPTTLYSVDYALGYNGTYSTSLIYDYAEENNPWGSGEDVLPVTKYINNVVGNIASDNYLNLSPNIGSDEYMYIFDRPTYIETLNQITNNTDNGDYSDNSTVINNFNETNIQEPDYVTVRPSTAPAYPDQPVQPFISPRPTQAPADYEGVIYEGGISEEITKKFPFCIPWDIKAMIDRLWTPESRAPYIHWDANFGSWGKLGEIDIDLQDFNGVAAIFRATTLLLWIVWLVTITRDLLG